MAHSPIRAMAFAMGLLALAPAALAESENPVVAKVNGEEILFTDVMAAYDQLPQQLKQMPFQQIYPQLLERVITFKLVAAEGREAGLHEESDVQAEIRRLEDRVIERAYFQRQIEERLTDQRLQAAYDEYEAEQKDQKEVHARHILVETEDEAAKLIEEIEGGADFAALAKEHSSGPSSVEGGDLGFIGPGDTVEAFQEAAFKLGKGEVTPQPVQTQFGWHVIKVEEVRPATVEAFEKVEAKLRDQLTEEIVAEVIEDVRADAEIEKMDPPPAAAPQQPAPQPAPKPAE